MNSLDLQVELFHINICSRVCTFFFGACCCCVENVVLLYYIHIHDMRKSRRSKGYEKLVSFAYSLNEELEDENKAAAAALVCYVSIEGKSSIFEPIKFLRQIR